LYCWVSVHGIVVLVDAREWQAIRMLHCSEAFIKLATQLRSVHRDEFHRVRPVQPLVDVHGMVERKDGVER